MQRGRNFMAEVLKTIIYSNSGSVISISPVTILITIYKKIGC